MNSRNEFKHVAFELDTGAVFFSNNTRVLKKGRWVFAHRTHRSALENLRIKLKEKYNLTDVI